MKKLLRIPATATKRLVTEPKKYARLARQYGWLNKNGSVWPVSRQSLLCYIMFSQKKGNQPATISTYLSTLAKYHMYKGYFKWRKEVRMHPTISIAVQNIKAHHLFSTVKQKEPITTDMLQQIKNRCNLSNPHQALFWCIATVAFHTLSRLGELTVSDQRRIPWAIRLSNLNDQTKAEIPFITITLPRTKVHNPSKPEFILIRATHDTICPLEAFTNYLKMRQKPSYAPGSTGLFVLSNGAFASRNWFLGGLKQVLPTANVASQSFRAGGATHLAMRGAPRLVLQRLGRWNSATFEQYVRTQPAIVAALSEPYTNSSIAQSLMNRRPATPCYHAGEMKTMSVTTTEKRAWSSVKKDRGQTSNKAYRKGGKRRRKQRDSSV